PIGARVPGCGSCCGAATFGGPLVVGGGGGGSGFGAGGQNGCLGRSTVCTISGLSVWFVPRGVTATSGPRPARLRSTLKINNPPPKTATNNNSLPLFVLKKLRTACGFIVCLRLRSAAPRSAARLC